MSPRTSLGKFKMLSFILHHLILMVFVLLILVKCIHPTTDCIFPVSYDTSRLYARKGLFFLYRTVSRIFVLGIPIVRIHRKTARSTFFLNTVNMAKSIPACNRLTVQKKFAAFMTGIRTKKVPHSPVSKIAWFGLELDLFLVPFPLMFPKENKLLFFYRHHYGILYIFKSEANKQRFLCFGLLFY